ncbi:amino acid ABC transporter substrate-binding protein [Desulfovibrio inopinatus]|uniref:amino acid ABC transporter substrate-binding protein n=1 Tax=Desulfovibrio inopinatus TaxID=102109 RepID=UPI0004190D72|nr:amino acid ABC transporter substrate-binding protein [Desulfovibrio inopinatus]
MNRIGTILIAALCVCLFAGTALAEDNPWKTVKDKGVLVIGLDDAFPPMGFRKDDGTLVGFDIDAAEEAGKRMGVEIKWQPTAWDGVILSLDAHKFDAIWNGMTITDERAEKVLFTKPYIMDGQIAVVAIDNKDIKSFDDLAGKHIGVQKGSSAVEAAKKLPKAPADVREYESNPKAFLDLDSGRLDAVVVDNISGRYYMSTAPGKYRALPGFITKEPFGVAFRKGDKALESKVQETIDAMVADGTMGKISRKWFGEDITNPKSW